MHAWRTFNASSTFKLIRHEKNVYVSLKLLNGQQNICNDYLLLRLYKAIHQE